jgi:lysosomal alpha-mannosidase
MTFCLQYEGLTRTLPENVQILTLEPWRDNTYLVRLEHMFEKDEDAVLSNPITIHLEVVLWWCDVYIL